VCRFALKNYSPDRRAVFATEADEIGKIEDKPELHTVLPVSLLQPLVRNGANCEVGCFVSLYHNTNVRQCHPTTARKSNARATGCLNSHTILVPKPVWPFGSCAQEALAVCLVSTCAMGST